MIAKDGWFAARPSGTEEIYKIYAESFVGQNHLRRSRKKRRPLFQKRWHGVHTQPEPISA